MDKIAQKVNHRFTALFTSGEERMDVGRKPALPVNIFILLFFAPIPHVGSDSSISWDATLNFSEEAVE